MFSRLDIFPKYKDELKVKTLSGAGVSIVAACVMVFLTISQFLSFLQPEIVDHLQVDTTGMAPLKINIDFLFPRLPCEILSLDLEDISGTSQVNIHTQNLKKLRLDYDGTILGEEAFDLGDKMEADAAAPSPVPEKVPSKDDDIPQEAKGICKDTDGKELGLDFKECTATEGNTWTGKTPGEATGDCGSCYGARDGCCNTCEDVRDAYKIRGWGFQNGKDIEQCKEEIKREEELLKKQEGCAISGFLEVKKVGGNFHFVPSTHFQTVFSHLDAGAALMNGRFNTEHTIRKLTFGDPSSSVRGKRFAKLAASGVAMSTNPLDGREAQASDGEGNIFQYYVKVIPTTFEDMSGKKTTGNQFSVTIHETTMRERRGQSLPGVWVYYELSPLMVRFSETRKSFINFITNLCAIVGGVFTVTGLMDRLIHGTLKSFRKKQELGKAG